MLCAVNGCPMAVSRASNCLAAFEATIKTRQGALVEPSCSVVQVCARVQEPEVSSLGRISALEPKTQYAPSTVLVASSGCLWRNQNRGPRSASCMCYRSRRLLKMVRLDMRSSLVNSYRQDTVHDSGGSLSQSSVSLGQVQELLSMPTVGPSVVG